jgi:hypothetical protein
MRREGIKAGSDMFLLLRLSVGRYYTTDRSRMGRSWWDGMKWYDPGAHEHGLLEKGGGARWQTDNPQGRK